MRQKVLSARTYRGFTIEHVESLEYHGSGSRGRKAGYYPHRFWWVVEKEWDEPRLKDAKAYIDKLIADDVYRSGAYV